MSSYLKLYNGRCYNPNASKYKQCNVLNDGRVIPSCSNVYGIDGWPASTPQQSNFRFTNGISQMRPPNGFKVYIQPYYLYNNVFYKPHTFIPFVNGLKLKEGKSKFIRNDIEYVLVEDILTSQLRSLNVLNKCGFKI